MVNERGTHGLYRVTRHRRRRPLDKVELLREIKGGGEHGLHAIVLSPGRQVALRGLRQLAPS